MSSTEKIFTEETCGNGVKCEFEMLGTEWFPAGEKPTYHGWPTLTNVGGDKLVVVCSGGREAHICPFGKVFLYESTDGGRSWNGPRLLVDGPLDDRDAGLVVTPRGTWLVNYFTSTHFASRYTREATPAHWKEREDAINITLLKKEHGFFLLRSEDQGRTWSQKYPIGVNNVHGPAVLQDGSLLYCGRGRSGNCLLSSTFADTFVVLRSTDDGLSWQEVCSVWGKFGEHPISQWHELHTVQASDGTIITQIRRADGTWQIESSDGGKSWGEPRHVCEGFPSHLLLLPDGRILMSYGYRKENYGNRCRISSDNGKSWSEPMILSAGSPTFDLGYPSTAQLSDGTLVTVWYEYKEDLKLAQLRCARWKLK